jgi:protein gp37
MARRLKAMGAAKYQTDGHPVTSGPAFGVAVHEAALTEPLRWRKPRRVFVGSMTDVGHARVPWAFLARMFAVMALAEQHTFQVLTKRPGRVAGMLADPAFQADVHQHAAALAAARRPGRPTPAGVWPLPNVWVGTSIESDAYCRRADALRRAPASVRFLSLEPLLGPLPSLRLDGIGWVIVGGESGPRHRPVDPDWVRSLQLRCAAEGVPFFFKQWGGRRPTDGGRLLDGRTWDEMPDTATAPPTLPTMTMPTPEGNR